MAAEMRAPRPMGRKVRPVRPGLKWYIPVKIMG
jgi:hypothetical protein